MFVTATINEEPTNESHRDREGSLQTTRKEEGDSASFEFPKIPGNVFMASSTQIVFSASNPLSKSGTNHEDLKMDNLI